MWVPTSHVAAALLGNCKSFKPSLVPPQAKCLHQDPSNCYAPTDPLYPATSNGLNQTVRNYMVQALIFSGQSPAKIANGRFQFIWNVGRNDVEHGTHVVGNLLRHYAQKAMNTAILIEGCLLALIFLFQEWMFAFLRPEARAGVDEIKWVAQMFSRLPEKMVRGERGLGSLRPTTGLGCGLRRDGAGAAGVWQACMWQVSPGTPTPSPTQALSALQLLPEKLDINIMDDSFQQHEARTCSHCCVSRVICLRLGPPHRSRPPRVSCPAGATHVVVRGGVGAHHDLLPEAGAWPRVPELPAVQGVEGGPRPADAQGDAARLLPLNVARRARQAACRSS